MTSENDNAEIASLKNQLFTLLVALVVVSGTLTIYLYRQASIQGKDIAQANQMLFMLSQKDGNIDSFVHQIVTYGQKHPDFAPVLKKYGLTPGALPPAGALPPH
jgi:hypothetical protein